jgi:rod shape-determining protein MreC
MLVNYNKTYQSFFSNNANEITGTIDKQYNGIEYYFRLKATNDELSAENARLKKLLFSQYNITDTSNIAKLDSISVDSTTKYLKYNVLPAKVVNSDISQENNYITIERGSNQGVVKDMGVTGPDGIVGRVILVSENYSRAMSLLNHNSKVSATLKSKNGAYNGIVDWDGKESDPAILLMHNISKSAQVKKGDTVLTSNLSGSYPPNLMVGRVLSIDADPSSNFYTLQVKAATNFYTLEYAYLIENNFLDEQKKLESQTPKNQ